MKNRFLPLWVSLLLYALLCLSLLAQAQALTGGALIYPVDDSYIHMAMARHFAQDGRWSVDLSPFTSTTSSPLWTLLLGSLFGLLGTQDWIPLALNLLIGAAALVFAAALLRQRASPLAQVFLLVLLLLFTPLPVLALTGMEHTLHALLSAALLFGGAGLVVERRPPARLRWGFLALCALLPVTRYEGLFLLLPILLGLAFQRRWGDALAGAVAGASLMSIYGGISLANGWDFLPNSVLLKGQEGLWTTLGMVRFLSQGIYNMLDTPALFGLILAVLLTYLLAEMRSALNGAQRWRVLFFAVMFALHLQLARVGWFFRYESYLVFCGVLVLADLAASLLQPLQSNPAINSPANKLKFTPPLAAGLALALLVLLPLAYRGGNALSAYPQGVANIHEQQVQMGRFVRQFYAGQTVAANDIGAIAYLADVRFLDFFGLASRDVAQLRGSQQWSSREVSQLVETHQPALVLIYDLWFTEVIPPEWIKVGEWQIQNNVVCGSDTVSFYGINPAQAAQAAANLKAFAASLPLAVIQSGAYLDAP
ncbi:MAG: hypothetical protein AB1453_10930 [Chloroflexota bacterium]